MLVLKLTQEEYLKIYRALEYTARVKVDTPTRSFSPTFADDARDALNLLMSIKRRRKMPGLLSEDDADAARKRARREAAKLVRSFKLPPKLEALRTRGRKS